MFEVYTLNTTALGKRIKQRREERGFSQMELAEKADISPQHLSRLECGLKTPRLETVFALSKALDMNIEELLGNTTSINSQFDNFLADCSDTEKRIIMDTAQALKNSLRNNK